MTAIALKSRMPWPGGIISRLSDAFASFAPAAEFHLSVETDNLASVAYRNQFDKDGIPLGRHIDTAIDMKGVLYPALGEPEGVVVRCLVKLHEILELHDGKGNRLWSVNNVLRRGFPESFVTRLEALTHKKGEPYLQYIWRASEYPEAIKAKRCDLHANMQRNVLDWSKMSARLRDKKDFLYPACDEYLAKIESGAVDRSIIGPFEYILNSPKWMEKIGGDEKKLRQYWDAPQQVAPRAETHRFPLAFL